MCCASWQTQMREETARGRKAWPRCAEHRAESVMRYAPQILDRKKGPPFLHVRRLARGQG